MKKYAKIAVAMVLMTLVWGCDKVQFIPDKQNLYGEWVTGTTHYRFDTTTWEYMIHDSTVVQVNGVRWDTSDDVTEEEGQPYNWSLNDASLQLIHQGYMGQVVPRTYTVLSLDGSKMVWEDPYGRKVTLNKR